MASKLPGIKLATMRRVQATALALFETKGFDAVSVADVAEAAGVAERSVYRYFATKEGIVVWNESDDDFFARVVDHLGTRRLPEALRGAIQEVDREFTSEQRTLAGRQVSLIDSTPQLRAHLAASFDDAARGLGDALAAARGRDPDDLESHLDASLATTALTSATFAWERAGRPGPLSQVLDEALDVLETWGQR